MNTGLWLIKSDHVTCMEKLVSYIYIWIVNTRECCYIWTLASRWEWLHARQEECCTSAPIRVTHRNICTHIHQHQSAVQTGSQWSSPGSPAAGQSGYCTTVLYTPLSSELVRQLYCTLPSLASWSEWSANLRAVYIQTPAWWVQTEQYQHIIVKPVYAHCTNKISN